MFLLFSFVLFCCFFFLLEGRRVIYFITLSHFMKMTLCFKIIMEDFYKLLQNSQDVLRLSTKRSHAQESTMEFPFSPLDFGKTYANFAKLKIINFLIKEIEFNMLLIR